MAVAAMIVRVAFTDWEMAVNVSLPSAFALSLISTIDIVVSMLFDVYFYYQRWVSALPGSNQVSERGEEDPADQSPQPYENRLSNNALLI